MQKKKEKFLNKIVKKDYNNELEIVLEKKSIDENAKNLLLSILYKIEVGYKDYQKVKRNVKSKEQYIKKFINMINQNCNDIKICKMNSKEENILGEKTFLIDKEKKQITCYPIERKLLYSIAKISKNEKIVKKDYHIVWETLSNLINIGNNIELVEPLRDFNGYSWTTIYREIESIPYNVIYQNLRILLGQEFLEKWITNKEFIIDYMDFFKNRLEENYGIKNQKEIVKLVEKLSVLLEIKYNPDKVKEYKKQKEEIEKRLEKISDKEKYIEMVTQDKRKLAKRIKEIDETIYDKELLQKEYISRNEKLPLKKKIFSVRILSKLMRQERDEMLYELENLNKLLNPKNFVAHKREMEQKYNFLKLVELKNLEKEIENTMAKLQKVFLRCYQIKLKKVNVKSKIIDCLYEFRYYQLLPFNLDVNIGEVKNIQKELEETRKLLINKAQELKAIIVTSKNKEYDEKILKNIFKIRAIALEEIEIKLVKEKDKFYIQIFDEEMYEQKIELKDVENLSKKDIDIKLNKRIRVFC